MPLWEESLELEERRVLFPFLAFFPREERDGVASDVPSDKGCVTGTPEQRVKPEDEDGHTERGIPGEPQFAGSALAICLPIARAPSPMA